MEESVRDVKPIELAGKPVVSVAVELQPEGAPSWDAEEAKTEVVVNEIEVVVEALAVIRFEIGVAGFFVIPGLICCASFQS